MQSSDTRPSISLKALAASGWSQRELLYQMTKYQMTKRDVLVRYRGSALREMRDVLSFDNMPDWRSLAKYTAVALATMWLGFAWFQKTRRGFADLL